MSKLVRKLFNLSDSWDQSHTMPRASPNINTRSQSVTTSGFLIRYPAIVTRSTACT